MQNSFSQDNLYLQLVNEHPKNEKSHLLLFVRAPLFRKGVLKHAFLDTVPL